VTVPVYVYATILGNPSTQDLADAILEYGATLGANSSVDGPAVLSAVRSTIGVRKVTAFRVTRTSGLAPAAGVIDTSDVMISARSVANLAQANFHFTISP